MSTTQPLITQPPRPLPSFELTDTHGKPLTRRDLVGSWTILFFGFTHCPDVCPATLGRLEQVWTKLSQSERQRLQVLFVSVDPARDSSDTIAKYIEFYDPSFRGARGQTEQLDALTAALDASYELPPDTSGSYSVSHSSALFLINPRAERVGFFSSTATAKQVTEGLREVVKDTPKEPIIEDPWVRAAPPGAPVLAGYLTVANPSDSSLTLIGASSPLFERVELHESVNEQGVAKMRAVEALEIPPGGRSKLEPAGYHLMLIGPQQPLKEGDEVRIDLKLKGRPDLTLKALVRAG